MVIAELIRLETGVDGTFGVLRIDKAAFCVTLEPSDMMNRSFISSIPSGQYLCRRIHSGSFGETFEVVDVPGREAILFHPGNVVKDTAGCIILGEHFGKLNGDRALLNSGKTFNNFIEYIGDDDQIHLTIREVY